MAEQSGPPGSDPPGRGGPDQTDEQMADAAAGQTPAVPASQPSQQQWEQFFSSPALKKVLADAIATDAATRAVASAAIGPSSSRRRGLAAAPEKFSGGKDQTFEEFGQRLSAFLEDAQAPLQDWGRIAVTFLGPKPYKAWTQYAQARGWDPVHSSWEQVQEGLLAVGWGSQRTELERRRQVARFKFLPNQTGRYFAAGLMTLSAQFAEMRIQMSDPAQDDWDKLLPVVEYAINSSQHAFI